MNTPLLLTLVRILAIPILVIVLLVDFPGKEWTSFIVFVLASFTDMLDGYYARRKRQVTVLGQLLDPTADKLLVASVLICLVGAGKFPAWMAVVIICRELAVTGFRAVASSKGIHIPASPLGKVKMTLEAITISIFLLGEKILGPLYSLAGVFLWLTLFMVILSAAEYYVKYGPSVISGRT
jgi:CDP-diacylglycerol---glycerol-3-phosphate 3-phosphatidyltransferase